MFIMDRTHGSPKQQVSSNLKTIKEKYLKVNVNEMILNSKDSDVRDSYRHIFFFFFLFSLAPQPSLSLGLLYKIRLNFSEASQQFSFLHGRVVSPTPNPHPGELLGTYRIIKI
jgi:hypothetical protein